MSPNIHTHGVLAALTLGSWGHSHERGKARHSCIFGRPGCGKDGAGWLIELMGTGGDSELHPAVCTRFPKIACHHQSITVANGTGAHLAVPGAQCPSSS